MSTLYKIFSDLEKFYPKGNV